MAEIPASPGGATSPSKEDSLLYHIDENREKHILQMDANALMITLRELEAALTAESDPKVVPAWARSIIPRVEGLESKMTKAMKATKKSHDTADEVAAEDDHAVEKLIKEFASKLDLTKITFSSQVEALNLEVDRLQKLLQIRPTTSEMQKVILAIDEYKREIEGHIQRMQLDISLLVKDKVSEEMTSIMDRLKKSESTTEKGLNLVLRTVEEFGHEVEHIREGMHQAHTNICTSQDEMKSVYAGFDERFSTIENGIEESITNYTNEFADVRDTQGIANDNFDEFKEDSNQRFVHLETFTEKLESALTSTEESLEAKDDDQTSKNIALDEKVNDFRKTYDEDLFNLTTDITRLNTTTTEHEEMIAEHGAYIAQLKEMNIIEKVNVNGDNIALIQQKVTDFDERLTMQNTKIKKMEKLTQKVNEEMLAFPTHIQETNQRMDSIQSFLDTATSDMGRQKESFEGTISQVSELFKMADDVQLVKELGAQQDQRVKAVQSSLDSIMDGADEHDRLLEELQEQLQNQEATMGTKLDEIKNEVSGFANDEITKITAGVVNVKESLQNLIQAHEEMKSAHEGHKGHGHGVQGHASFDPDSLHEPSISVTLGQPVSDSHVEIVADQCINYEGISMRLTSVQEIPESISSQLSSIAQSVTAVIATQTDQEAVRSLLRGTAGDDVSPESLTEKSQRLVANFIDDVKNVVQTLSPEAGSVRLEAREKFFAQFEKALQTFMSKHDQVLIVGGSRYGKIKIPCCIACDRPLLNKIREVNASNEVKIPRSDTGGVKIFNNQKAPKINTKIKEEQQLTARDKPGTGPIRDNAPLVHRPIVSSGKSPMAQTQTTYVMRSGFKMPKPNMEVTGPGNEQVPLDPAQTLRGLEGNASPLRFPEIQ